MVWLWVVAAVPVALLIAWRPLVRWAADVQLERARESFRLQRERLEAGHFRAAAAGGKPRGLRWTSCDYGDALEMARDRGTSQLVALVPVTVGFEAVEGGDMEGVAAVSNLRYATAVFAFERNHWTTAGITLFNLNPAEALVHFKQQYERV